MNYDDETLMAYADGELDSAQRAEITAAMEKDPGLARRIDRHLALRTKVADAFASVTDQPVPQRLISAAIGDPAATGARRVPRSGQVLQFPAKGARAAGPAWTGREWGAMAASVMLGVLIAWRVFAPAEPSVMAASGGVLAARGELALALDQQLASNQRREDPVQIGVTFKARDGNYCRSFTLRETKTAGLACRANGEWQVAATALAEVPAGQMQQAAGTMPAAILSAIETRMAADALNAADEDVARLGGWDK